MTMTFNLKNISSTIFSNLVITATTIFQGIIIARVLGPIGKGDFTAIILWPTVLAGFLTMGTYTGIARIAAKNNDIPSLFNSSIIISLFTGILGMIISYFTLPFLLGKNGAHLLSISRTFSIFIIVNHLAKNILAIFHGTGNFKQYNLFKLILNPVYFGLLLILYVTNLLSIENCVYSYLIANIIVLLFRVISIFKIYKLEFRFYSPIKIIKNSLSFGVADMADPINQYFDKALLLWWLGTTELGLYTVSATAGGVIVFLTNAIAILSFTQTATNSSPNDIVKICRFVSFLYLIIGIFLSLFLPFLIPLLYGNLFAQSIRPAILLIIAFFFQGQANILEQSIRGAGKAFYGLEGRFISMVIFFIFGLYLSKLWGLNGIACSYIFSQIAYFLFMKYRFIKLFKVNESFWLSFNDIKKII